MGKREESAGFLGGTRYEGVSEKWARYEQWCLLLRFYKYLLGGTYFSLVADGEGKRETGSSFDRGMNNLGSSVRLAQREGYSAKGQK